MSEAGYRYYSHEDVMKLHHIATLKQLGFKLSGACLKKRPDSPASRRLAERLLEIEGQWFGNREDVLEKYWEWIRPEPGGSEKVLGLDEETMAYIERIFADGQAGVNMNHGWALQCYLRIIVEMHSILR
ncbi:hypothetical protein AV654_04295 [Paenibacillus elgii]|uniref:HTH merR-type domain-containing protein n=1 Tax=Paenibacillus elgii TaxID=189691 RepID=A0A165PW54_9BACL|nr:hypothetical protein AV654_04295 [Paenibacillus elgii]